MKYKFVYDVYLKTSLGLGIQPVKGNTKAEAREMFKKKYPKKSIISIDKRDIPLNNWNPAI